MKEKKNNIEITSIKIVKNQGVSTLAIASIVINDCFAINEIRIVQGREGLFISMPSRRILKGESYSFQDIAHPINQATRDYLKKIILDHYKSMEQE